MNVKILVCQIIGAAAATPCNLSLMACFADINVSRGNVATRARSDGIFNIYLICKFTKESSSENV